MAELEPGGHASRYIRGYGAAALEREGSYYGIHQDEQLSTGWTTGADGKIENGYAYDSFGNLLRNSAKVPNRYGSVKSSACKIRPKPCNINSFQDIYPPNNRYHPFQPAW